MSDNKTRRYENFTELAEFARAVFSEYNNPTSEIHKLFKAGFSSPAPDAFRQFIIEVGNGYGFGGISHMTPEQWFNSDLPLRQRDADTIAAFYERYKAVPDVPVTEANDIQAELDKLRATIASQAAAIAKLTEAAAEEKDAEVDKAMGKEDSAEEEKSESDAEKEAEKD